MAYFATGSDYLQRATPLPATGERTFMAWFRQRSAPPSYNVAFGTLDADPPSYTAWLSNFNYPTAFNYEISGMAAITYTPPSVTGWHHMTLVAREITAGTWQQELWIDGCLRGIQAFNATAFAAAYDFIGNDSFTDGDIDVVYQRQWTAALNQDEILVEMASETLVRDWDVFSDVPLLANPNDISGNGRNYTAVGSVTYPTELPLPLHRLYITSANYQETFFATAKGTWNAGATTNLDMLPFPAQDGGLWVRASTETVTTNPYRVRNAIAVSPPLAAAITPSGTIDIRIGINESDAAADMYWRLFAWWSVGDTDVIRSVALDYEEDTTNEFPAGGTLNGTIRGLQAPVTLSGSAQIGDRLIVEIGLISRNAVSTSRTARFFLGTGLLDFPWSYMPTGEKDNPINTTASGYASTLLFTDAFQWADQPEYPPAPANDLCVNAIDITASLPFIQSLDTRTATASPDDPQSDNGSGGDGASIWYEFTPAVTTITRVDLKGSNFNDQSIIASVWAGPCGGPFTELGYTDFNEDDVITFTASGGMTYRIQQVTYGWPRGSDPIVVRVQTQQDYFPLIAGSASLANSGAVVDLVGTAADDGSPPYTYQWYRSTASGFTPSPSTLLTGATTLTYRDSTSLVRDTIYYYTLRASDSDGNYVDYTQIQAFIPPEPGESTLKLREEFEFLDPQFQLTMDSDGGTAVYRRPNHQRDITNPADPQDLEYPCLSSAWMCKPYAGAGPDGQNTLDWYQGSWFEPPETHPNSWNNCGHISYQNTLTNDDGPAPLQGTLPSGTYALPSGRAGWFAQRGYLEGYQYFRELWLEFAGLTQTTFGAVLRPDMTLNSWTVGRSVAGFTVNNAPVMALGHTHPSSYDPVTDTVPMNVIVRYRTSTTGSSFTDNTLTVLTVSGQAVRDLIYDQWLKWRLEWCCGSRAANGNVNPDGWFDVYLNDALIASRTGLRICFNQTASGRNIVADMAYAGWGQGMPGAVASLRAYMDGGVEPSPMPPDDPICDCVIPEEGDDLCSLEDHLIFGRWSPRGSDIHKFAEVDLPDPSGYYSGLKSGRLTTVTPVTRQMSSSTWDYITSTFGFSVADEDYEYRAELCQAPGKYFTDGDVDLYAVTPSTRRVQGLAHLLAAGVVDSDPSYDYTDTGVIVSFMCRDHLGARFAWTRDGQTKVPLRVITAASLPGAPGDLVGKGVPFPYGMLGAFVVASGVLSRPIGSDGPCSSTYDPSTGTWGGGFVSRALPAQASATATVLPGGSISLAGPSATYYFHVFPIGADGTVYDPYPFCPNSTALTATVTSGNQTVRIDWPLHPDAVRYQVFFSFFYYYNRPLQMLETTGLSVTFTNSPDITLGYSWDGTDITPGAVVPTWSPFWYYRVRARQGILRSEWNTPDASGFNVFGFMQSRFSTLTNGVYTPRPERLWWEAVSGASAYEIQRRGPVGDWLMQWTVPADQIDTSNGDQPYFDEYFDTPGGIVLTGEPEVLTGKVAPIYAGQADKAGEIMHRWMLAGCAIKSVDTVYYNDGENETEVNEDIGTGWWRPGQAEYASLGMTGPYEDIVGTDGVTRRYCFLYGYGTKANLIASGIGTLTVDMQGIERIGDGSGEVITGLIEQHEHMLNNLLLASGEEAYLTGNWPEPPTFMDDGRCMVDCESFYWVNEQRAAEYGAELEGAGIVGAFGERVTITEELRRWAQCGDFRHAIDRHWRIGIHALNRRLDLSDAPLLTDVNDFHKQTFRVVTALPEMYNRFTYRHSRSYATSGAWDANNLTYLNETSRNNWNRVQDLDISFHYLQNAEQVDFILNEISTRMADAPEYVDVEGSPCLMASGFDIGQYFLMNHWRGVGIRGYRQARMWILGFAYLPGPRRVRLRLQNVSNLLPTPSTLAPVWATPTDPTFEDASEEDRDRLGFWGDPNGRVGGTVVPAKTWS